MGKKTLKINRFALYVLIMCLIFTLSNCAVQKRVYRKGWNIEWNNRTKGNSEISENEPHFTFVEKVAREQKIMQELRIESIDSLSKKENIRSLVALKNPDIHSEHSYRITNAIYHIVQQKITEKIDSKLKKQQQDHHKHYLLPLICLAVGTLLILLAMFAIIPINNILGILIFLLGILLVLFALIKVIALLVFN